MLRLTSARHTHTHADIAVQIAVGSSSTCALTSAGGVRCWGRNTEGQLGYGDATQRTLPGPNIDFGGELAVQVDVGYTHGCALMEGGTVRCWGSGQYGKLGYGTSANLLSPGASSGL